MLKRSTISWESVLCLTATFSPPNENAEDKDEDVACSAVELTPAASGPLLSLIVVLRLLPVSRHW